MLFSLSHTVSSFSWEILIPLNAYQLVAVLSWWHWCSLDVTLLTCSHSSGTLNTCPLLCFLSLLSQGAASSNLSLNHLNINATVAMMCGWTPCKKKKELEKQRIHTAILSWFCGFFESWIYSKNLIFVLQFIELTVNSINNSLCCSCI